MNYREEILKLENKENSGCSGALVPGIIRKGKGHKFIVFGLNPAEAKDDLEGFFNKKFYIFDPDDEEASNTRSQRRWTKKISDILPADSQIIQAEMIYWTSQNRKSLENLIGKLDFGNPYFDLSQKINNDLISNNKDALIIMLGYDHIDLFEKVFDLPELEKTINGQNNKRLLYKYKSNNKFFAVRHPSSRGLTNIDKEKIKTTLESSII